jgi:hypothetical protein
LVERDGDGGSARRDEGARDRQDRAADEPRAAGAVDTKDTDAEADSIEETDPAAESGARANTFDAAGSGGLHDETGANVPSDDPRRSPDSDGADEAEAPGGREQGLRGYRSVGQDVAEPTQSGTDVETAGGTGTEGGTDTVGDGGASGQHDGGPLPPRLVAKLPRPGGAEPAVVVTGFPPPVPPAPNLEGLVTGAVSPAPAPEPTVAADDGDDPDSRTGRATPRTRSTAAATRGRRRTMPLATTA